MYEHVLCVYPYRVELGRDGYYPPLGLEMIAAALKPYAKKIDVVDLRKEPGRTVDFIRDETDLVAFSVNWDREADFVREEIRSVPEKLFTMAGGRHATIAPEDLMNDCPNIDLLVRGDGEEVVEELARGTPPAKVAGVTYRRNGHLEHGANRNVGAVAEDLRPDRARRRYTYEVEVGSFKSGMRLDSVASSRGCPFNCVYCSFSLNPWGTKRHWSARTPEAVVREIMEIDAPLVIFTDDNFTHDMNRVGKICDLLMEKGIRKRYLCNARLEVARRPDVLRKMERAGFSMLLLGIESTKDATLKSMRKGFDTKKIREYFKVLRRSSMLLHGYFIVGNIGESEEEMLSVARFATELGVDSLGLCILRNAPHSALADLVANSPGYYIDPQGYVCSETHNARQLRKLRSRINARFYTPGHVVHLLKKSMRNKLLTPWLIARLVKFGLGKAWSHLWR